MFLIHGGYKYKLDDRSNPSGEEKKKIHRIFRCTKRTNKNGKGCRASVREVDGEIVSGTVQHSCKYNQHQKNDEAAKEEMKKRCLGSNLMLVDIYCSVLREFKDEGLQTTLRWACMKQCMERLRKAKGYKQPYTLRDLALYIMRILSFTTILKGIVTVGEDTALIFSSDALLYHLNNSSEVFLDGTFKVCPKVANICQLYTVVIRVMDKSVGTVFVLMNRRTAALYTALFLKLQELCPNLKYGLHDAMADFEEAVQKSINEIFPNCAMHGCWFHAKKAMRKRWKKLGLKNTDCVILTMAFNLALAPVNRFFEGVEIMKSRIDDYDHTTGLKLSAFVRYVTRYWGRRRATLCVGNLSHRTNNLSESLNNRLGQKFGGKNVRVWRFLDILLVVIKDEEIRHNMLVEGVLSGELMREKDKLREIAIFEAQEELEAGGYLELFLQTFTEFS